jgi:hypothetical protein
VSENTQGKGRPTPKRSEVTKRRGGPVTPPPTNRRAAAKQLRAKQADNRQRIKVGTAAGDDKAMLPRDRGPVRRLVRNTIDSRRSLGFLLLPVAGLLVVAQLLRDPVLLAIAVGVWLATLLGVAVDLLLTGMQLRTTIKRTFPDEQKVRGHVAYGLLRSTVIRRFRMPRPQVKRGNKG